MNGKKEHILKLIKGVDSLIIPVYQRNYDWTVEQCRQLFDDLRDVMKDGHEHFFGSIVSVELDQNSKRLIIDGQQRLATVSIMLVALDNLLKEKRLSVKDKKLASKIFLYYIFNDDSSEDNKTKLQLIKTDQTSFTQLLNDANQHVSASNITRNYNFFYDQIQRLNSSADDILNAIKQLSIIDITLDRDHDDAQKIFESLNSTGLDLNEGDKIRNFVLMNLTAEQQENYYNNYWHKIEELTKPANALSFNVSAFVRDYLTVKLNKIPVEKNVHADFKAYVAKTKIDIEELLKDMLKYARYYEALNSARTDSEGVNVILRRLSLLKLKGCIPYFLAVCNHYAEQNISEDEFVEVFRVIESFAFRRLICDVESRAYSKLFPALHKEVLKQATTYVDALKYVLMLKRNDNRFPNDAEFLEYLEEKDVINMNTNNKIYLFSRLEDGDEEPSDVLEKLVDKHYVIDRIIPKNLSLEWKRELGANALIINSCWSNRLANLTVVDSDSKLSNRSFYDKKFMPGGFKQSHLRLNEYIAQCSRWTENELLVRQSALNTVALKLWKYPQSDFQPSVKEYDVHSLDEDFSFTGREIVSYSFLGDRYPAKNWADMLVQMLRTIHTLDSSHLYQFAKNYPGMFHSNALDSGERIGKNLYVKTLSDTNFKIRMLQKLFDACGLNEEDLEFELKPLNN